MKGKYDKADAVDPNFLNHVIWYSATDWTRPYPGENKVLDARAIRQSCQEIPRR